MKIGIIGGGFSGTAVAINLLRLAKGPDEIFIVEKTGAVGEGAAYGTKLREHITNVPLHMLNCIPDDPTHLFRWLEQNSASVGMEDPERRTVDSFIPRQVYSLYIKDTLQKAQNASRAKLNELKDEALQVSLSGQTAVEIKFASGKNLRVDKLVLCLGNEPSRWPLPTDNAPSERLIGDPWKTDYTKLPKNAAVLIVGTGLTMADAVVSLMHNGHQGDITAISRRGVLPKANDQRFKPLELKFQHKQRTAFELFTEILEIVTRHTSRGGDWREVVDGMRPWTSKLWKSLSIEERKLLLLRGRLIWLAHRTRIAPEVHAILMKTFFHGRSKALKGHVRQLGTSKDGKVVATLQETDEEAFEQHFDFVINCTGPNHVVKSSQNPLVQNLLKEGLILPGDTGIGLKIDEDGRCIGSKGPSNLIYACGPQLLDRDFEAGAVPELRQHAHFSAQNILSRL